MKGVALSLAMLASLPAHAADWTRAGGGLFAGTSSAQVLDVRAPSAPSSEVVEVPAPIEPYAAAIDAAARGHGLDPKLLHALVIVESAYRARARSRAGAEGLSQLMPATAANGGLTDTYEPHANLDGGARYLALQILRFHDLRLALAAYNSGPARVARLRRVPPIAETQAYVGAVVDCYLALSAGRSPRAGSECASVRNGGR